jgi:dihydroorotase-like cyclic amidohydrolase
MISESPAKLLGLKKGHIIPGYDADFITLDIKNPRKITSNHLHSKHTMTPFEGHYGLFPDNVYVRGHPIIEDGGLIARPGQGSFILSSQEGS